MATNYKITFKNHCTPQEYITENSRWYLDSDVGAKLTGTANWTGAEAPAYGTGALSGVQIVTIDAGANDFYYIKNTGATGDGGFTLAFGQSDPDGSEADGYRIYLGPGESFASHVRAFTNLTVKSTATTTYEYVTAT